MPPAQRQRLTVLRAARTLEANPTADGARALAADLIELRERWPDIYRVVMARLDPAQRRDGAA